MTTPKTIKCLFFAIILCISQLATAFEATNLQVLDVDKLKLVTYTSAEFNGFIPTWIIQGDLKSANEVKDILLADMNRSACTVHVFNLGSTDPVEKTVLVNQLLIQNKVLTLWKYINGKPHFEDLESGFALTFVCLGFDPEKGEIVELDVVDFSMHFENLLKLF
jgi:hypothetical protein